MSIVASFSEPLDLKGFMQALEMSNLNHDEIQRLVDVLLDKQKSANQWKKVSSHQQTCESCDVFFLI